MLSDIGLGLVNSIFATVTILVLSLFMGSSGRRFLDTWARRYPPEREAWMRNLFERIGNAIGNYMAGALLQATIAGVTSYLMLLILGIDYALPLAVIVFVLDLLPLVGATLGAIIVGIVTLFSDFPVDTLIWAVFAIVYQQVENNVIQPRIQSRAVQLDPLVVLVAGPVRLRAGRRARRAARDPGRRVDPDHDPRVPGAAPDARGAAARAVRIRRDGLMLGVIGAPTSAGAFAPGQEQAPAALRAAGLPGALRAGGREVRDQGDREVALAPRPRRAAREERRGGRRDRARGRGAVAAAARAGELPLVLGGDCTVGMARSPASWRRGEPVGSSTSTRTPTSTRPPACPTARWTGWASRICSTSRAPCRGLAGAGPDAAAARRRRRRAARPGPGAGTDVRARASPPRASAAIPVAAVAADPRARPRGRRAPGDRRGRRSSSTSTST